MTDQRKRRRNRSRGGSSHAAGTLEQHASVPASQAAISTGGTMPMPNWKWRTFPVYFALSFGLMLGIYLGWLAGFVAADSDNQTPTTVVFIVGALLFGFALSRFTSRWLLARRWIKTRTRTQ